MAIPTVLQVLLASIIVILLLVIAYAQYNKEKLAALRDVGRLKKKVPIFSGVKDFSTNKDEEYETADSRRPTYRELPPSTNQDAGAEYSYNFWLYFDQDRLTSDTRQSNTLGNYKFTGTGIEPDRGLKPSFVGDCSTIECAQTPVVLFMRGDPKLYYFKSACAPTNAPRIKYDVMVKNPLVKLELGGDVLTVEFNTVDSPEARKACGSTGTWEAANSHKVGVKGLVNDNMNKKWFMVTIVIQQSDPTMSLSKSNHTICSIYINGKRKSTQQVSGLIDSSPVRQQTGNVYFNNILRDKFKDTNTTAYSHDITLNGALLMSDLSYFNYGLEDADVLGLFNAGFNRNPAPPYATITDLTGWGVSDQDNTDISRQTDDLYMEINNNLYGMKKVA